MPKRITYLTKRDDLTREQFRAHWATPHAAIAVDLPGVVSYRQNHVVSEGASRYDIDGIVELWFASDDAVGAGLDSDVADRLIEDEQRFLSGIVGGTVLSGAPTPHWPYKVWVLVRTLAPWAGDGVSVWVDDTATSVGALGHAVNVADDDGPRLVRERLRVSPEPPRVSVCFGFENIAAATGACDDIARASRDLDGVIDADVLLAEELVII
ncbi:uncharacterized protein (TIGR02118 family) [Microbacterium sp. W4I4]|uniref:EthD domain-containing protein n=1 Tax=Microbacterium sp. W4I4 TaxID=3042295 RepID=UPI002782C8F5|nr:EthD domain-containing protein [Microbacterium sp. W4I4]MDQ0615169.1 uncharacterized protein (TIGR02118 family) [Microbacterium sp. W4I4]